MAQVLAFIPDLLFGSRVQAASSAAGHDVVLVADADGVREGLVDVDVLVVDLTDEPVTRAGLVESLSIDGLLKGTVTLAFYSHVEAEVRDIAEKAGFDLVIPRSRMAREGADLIARLLN
ncbi:MAG TPA: hypothetical protein VK730_00245 [Solirubrobacteraceae bacterium]|jgi:hypothetical protein|nr:hypothetical protein [Solirubrobacteraceae bacterium]